jgi:hypothetical protein
MREGFAHDAVVTMDGDADVGAPGAAITKELCGHWEHDGPCPLAPHHTDRERDGETVRLRVLFAAEPADEAEVRRRIDDALSRGRLEGRDGTISCWRLLAAEAGAIRPDEADHVARLRG